MSTKKISRRDFLKAASIVMVAGTLTACGGGSSASQMPAKASQQKPSVHCGDKGKKMCGHSRQYRTGKCHDRQ